MGAHYEISTRVIQVRIYDRPDTDQYSACFQVYLDGDKAFIHSLIGRAFYTNIADMIKPMMKQVGVKTLEGYMTRPHAEVMKKVLEKIVDVEIVGPGRTAERDMVWVKLTDKDFLDNPHPQSI